MKEASSFLFFSPSGLCITLTSHLIPRARSKQTSTDHSFTECSRAVFTVLLGDDSRRCLVIWSCWTSHSWEKKVSEKVYSPNVSLCNLSAINFSECLLNTLNGLKYVLVGPIMSKPLPLRGSWSSLTASILLVWPSTRCLNMDSEISSYSNMQFATHIISNFIYLSFLK